MGDTPAMGTGVLKYRTSAKQIDKIAIRPLPPFHKMWMSYPDTTDTHAVGVLIGGGVRRNLELSDEGARWTDTCAIRMSRALNYAGDSIPKKAKYLSVVSGGDSFWYAYRVKELVVHLQKAHGSPSLVLSQGTNSADLAQIRGKKGVVVFEGARGTTGVRHIDLWDGEEIRYNDLTKDPQISVTKIMFWEAKP